MKSAVVTALLAAVLATPALADAKPDPRTVTTSGEGSVSAAPDLAIISSGVTTVATTAAEALKANASSMAKVFEAAKKAGIEDRDVATSGLSVQPQYDYGDGQKPRAPKLTGYQARNMVTIRIRAIDKAGAVVDSLVQAGSNEIEGFSFDVSDRGSKLDAARRDAVADARRKAELLATAAGAKLGHALQVTEESDRSEPVRPFDMRAKAMDAAPQTEIAKGEQELSANVTVRWLLED